MDKLDILGPLSERDADNAKASVRGLSHQLKHEYATLEVSPWDLDLKWHVQVTDCFLH